MPTHGYRIRFFLPHTNTKHSPLLLTRCTRRFSDYVGGHFFENYDSTSLWRRSTSNHWHIQYFPDIRHLRSAWPLPTPSGGCDDQYYQYFPDFNTWWFICSRVNIGIFSNDVPHPVVGKSAAPVLFLTSSELVPCFCFLRLYILCGSGSMICLSLPLRMYSYTRFTSSAFVFKPFPVSPRHFSQNLSSEFFNSSGFHPSREALGISFSCKRNCIWIAWIVRCARHFQHLWPCLCYKQQQTQCDAGLIFTLLAPGFPRGPPLWKSCMTFPQQNFP